MANQTEIKKGKQFTASPFLSYGICAGTADAYFSCGLERSPIHGYPELTAPWGLQTGFETALLRQTLGLLVEQVGDTATQGDFAVEQVIEDISVLSVHQNLGIDQTVSLEAVSIGSEGTVGGHVVLVARGDSSTVITHVPVRAQVDTELRHRRNDTAVAILLANS